MTNKDCKDFEDIMRKINPKGPNDLEEQIRVLKFRNEKLHNQNAHSHLKLEIAKTH